MAGEVQQQQQQLAVQLLHVLQTQAPQLLLQLLPLQSLQQCQLRGWVLRCQQCQQAAVALPCWAERLPLPVLVRLPVLLLSLQLLLQHAGLAPASVWC